MWPVRGADGKLWWFEDLMNCLGDWNEYGEQRAENGFRYRYGTKTPCKRCAKQREALHRCYMEEELNFFCPMDRQGLFFNCRKAQSDYVACLMGCLDREGVTYPYWLQRLIAEMKHINAVETHWELSKIGPDGKEIDCPGVLKISVPINAWQVKAGGFGFDEASQRRKVEESMKAQILKVTNKFKCQKCTKVYRFYETSHTGKKCSKKLSPFPTADDCKRISGKNHPGEGGPDKWPDKYKYEGEGPGRGKKGRGRGWKPGTPKGPLHGVGGKAVGVAQLLATLNFYWCDRDWDMWIRCECPGEYTGPSFKGSVWSHIPPRTGTGVVAARDRVPRASVGSALISTPT